jgi:hypothetical protein
MKGGANSALFRCVRCTARPQCSSVCVHARICLLHGTLRGALLRFMRWHGGRAWGVYRPRWGRRRSCARQLKVVPPRNHKQCAPSTQRGAKRGGVARSRIISSRSRRSRRACARGRREPSTFTKPVAPASPLARTRARASLPGATVRAGLHYCGSCRLLTSQPPPRARSQTSRRKALIIAAPEQQRHRSNQLRWRRPRRRALRRLPPPST